MFCKAVVIRLTALFEELTVTVTPGVCGLGGSTGVAAARKRRFSPKCSLMHSAVCLGFHFNKNNSEVRSGGKCGSEQRDEAVGVWLIFHQGSC